ncbi:MAG: DUF349 domain-containing protein [Bacteroidota bacterium]|nr:DUF349 domain-containing protein [Bacteroidota bacterium]
MNEENKALEPLENGTDATSPKNSLEKEATAIKEHTATENGVDVDRAATEPATAKTTAAETDVAEADITETVKPIPVSEEQFLETEGVVIADEAHEEAEGEPVEEDYSTYSIEDLVALLEKYVAELEVPKFKTRIANIRNYLSNIFAAAAEVAREKFLEEGSVKEDFAPPADPLEDRFHQAIKKFNKKRVEYNERLEKQRQENLVAKNDILGLLKDLIQNEVNMNKAFERFHELQAKWRSVGPVPSASVKDLQMTYKFLIDKFYDFIKINRELQDLDQRRNLEAKLHLCEQADELLMESSLNNAFRKLHQIQDKWRETGPVPRDKKNEIWDRFKATCDKLFERHKEYLDQASVQRAKNYEEKTALCDAVEAFKTEESWKHKDWQEATAKIGELQASWKKIGPADKKVNDEIWNRFKTACDAFYKSKNDFYHKRKQEYAANMQMKTELCIQAEALQASNDWKSTTAELIRLQQEWKKTGPVGEKHSEKIWKRFRTACDAFFTHKSEHFSSMDKEHDENLIKKIAFIEELEKFIPGEDTNANFEELKGYQRRWSEMGMVPMNKKDEINNRYKTIIDGHFDKLKASSGDRPKNRYVQKSDYVRNHEAPRKGDDERRVLTNKITELKNDVQVWENNIGFFAKSKNAEKLKSEFEEKINQAKAEISKLKSKLEVPREE